MRVCHDWWRVALVIVYTAGFGAWFVCSASWSEAPTASSSRYECEWYGFSSHWDVCLAWLTRLSEYKRCPSHNSGHWGRVRTWCALAYRCAYVNPLGTAGSDANNSVRVGIGSLLSRSVFVMIDTDTDTDTDTVILMQIHTHSCRHLCKLAICAPFVCFVPC